MKYAHIADCHIGGWRDPQLSDLSIKAFELAIDKVIEEKVDFVLLAGDLFNTSLPAVDKLKEATRKLKQLKDNDIPVYMIAGSHDYSPSGKTMLDVLENAGLAVNVCKGEEKDGKLHLKFTIDKKTGAKITGILGRMGSLDKNYFENLAREPLEKETGYKIFLFHALLTELKPKNLDKVDSHPLSLLPKNFNYYAGGHPHFVHNEDMKGYGRVCYTGPLFPNSFSELEELGNGGFFIVENDEVKRISIKLYDVERISIGCNHDTAEQAEEKLRKALDKDLKSKIVTMRMSGTLESGKPSDIDFRQLFTEAKAKGAFAILRNTSALTSKEFEEIKVELSNPEEVEEKLIEEYIDKDSVSLTKELLKTLDTQKQEGETVYVFEKRLKDEIDRILR
ncbi:exonuclease SbcCD subunit D [Candidatus Woesearchaeota archaeon]|nr:exonuclease SbcCD subunit D [Candidatus Woesearchaeota archaeon]